MPRIPLIGPGFTSFLFSAPRVVDADRLHRRNTGVGGAARVESDRTGSCKIIERHRSQLLHRPCDHRVRYSRQNGWIGRYGETHDGGHHLHRGCSDRSGRRDGLCSDLPSDSAAVAGGAVVGSQDRPTSIESAERCGDRGFVRSLRALSQTSESSTRAFSLADSTMQVRSSRVETQRIENGLLCKDVSNDWSVVAISYSNNNDILLLLQPALSL